MFRKRLKKRIFQFVISQQSGRGGVSAQNPVGEVSLFEPDKLMSLAVEQLANMRL